MKIALLVLWIACAAAFVLPDSAWSGPGRTIFVGLVLVHAVEFVIFLPRLRAAGGSLGQHFVQTMLYGVLHLRTIGAKPS